MGVSKRMRIVGGVTAGLAILIALFYAEEDWRGAREWARVKAGLSAKGEPLSIEALTPPLLLPGDEVPPILAELYRDDAPKGPLGSLSLQLRVSGVGSGRPDAPKVAGVGDRVPFNLAAWQKPLTGKVNPADSAADIVEALQPSQPVLDELRAALAPPVRCTLPPQPFLHPPLALRNRYYPQIGVGRFLQLKAMAEIEAGRGDAALDDLETGFRFSEWAGEGDTRDQQIGGMDGEVMLAALRQGLEKRMWNEEQLRRAAQLAAEFQPLSAFREAARRERVFVLRDIDGWAGHPLDLGEALFRSSPSRDLLETIVDVAIVLRPRGWARIDEASYAEAVQAMGVDAVDPEHGCVDAGTFQRGLDLVYGNGSLIPAVFFHGFGIMAFRASGFAECVSDNAISQSQTAEARIACALEGYRLRAGTLPETLDTLVPDFLPVLPVDPLGLPLRYRVEGDGYLLYSPESAAPEQGSQFPPAERRIVRRQRDWTWASRPDLYKFLPERGP